MRLYAISGLGADKRVFQHLSLHCELIPLDWIDPLPGESIEDYALRLSENIDTKDQFGILGVSFGGLIAVEISKKLNPDLTILISSAETRKELPIFYRLIGKTKILKFIPNLFFKPPDKLAAWVFSAKEKALLYQILKDTDLKFAKWAVLKLTTWKNNQRLVNETLKIHGSKDNLLPLKATYDKHVIKGGGHFMIVDRSDEISKVINEKINPRN
ncbi:alpha/beta hydrolase [Mangrovivirga sp. M17]|uniref:Alpha/beta hydrolase n=1 Tax=Mangrovivirga halotolerans TaxID=2993936 RepID=A0ABT3RPZ4_9BACT|nr:alpha/beta hydrolase [Mangrovivirga halotolerans]MCX2743332.1 alpha/beta hydrolase [Mangrovivirga halotolerans]